MRTLPILFLFSLLLAPLASWADDYEETIDVPFGGTLRVDLNRGSIEVETHDQERVEIDASLRGKVGLDVHRDGDEVIVRSAGPQGFFGFGRGGRVRIRIRVPQEFHVDLNTRGGNIDVQKLIGHVVARTSGGRIEVQQIDGNVAAETSGGRIEAKEVDGDLFASTSGGSIRASEVHGEIEAETSGGTIRVSKAASAVFARTSGGSVEVDFSGQPAGDLRTTGGSIEIEVPKGAGFHLRARTSGGQVDLDDEFHAHGSVSKSRVDVELNGGGSDLEAHTSGGSIKVKQD